MADLKTTQENTRTPLDGTELVRLATAGANWKDTLAAIFADGHAPASGFLNLQHSGFGSAAVVDSKIGINLIDAVTTVGANIYAGLSNTSTVANPNINSFPVYAGFSSNVVASGVGDYSEFIGNHTIADYEGTGSVSSDVIGVLCRATAGGSGTVAELDGGVFNVFAGGTTGGDVNFLNGGVFTVFFSDKASIGTLLAAGNFGISTTHVTGGSGKTIANAFTVFANQPSIGGNHTITNVIGVDIEDHSGIGTGLSENIRSHGANSVNTFEGTITITDVAVASLPAAGVKGRRKTVNNATQTLTAGIGAIVAGGGGNIVPVFDDGTNWRIG